MSQNAILCIQLFVFSKDFTSKISTFTSWERVLRRNSIGDLWALVLRCEFNIHQNLKLSRIPAFTWSTQDLFFLYESLTQIWPRWSEKVGLGLLEAKIDEWFVQVDWCSSPSGRSWQQFERSSYPAFLDSTRPLADKLTGDRYTQESGRYQFYFSDL